MKPVFRCEYCDELGVEEVIAKHELECIYNYTKRSCTTCKHAENKIIKFSCKLGKEIPEGKFFESCRSYEWDEKDHTTRDTATLNNLFGGLFG